MKNFRFLSLLLFAAFSFAACLETTSNQGGKAIVAAKNLDQPVRRAPNAPYAQKPKKVKVAADPVVAKVVPEALPARNPIKVATKPAPKKTYTAKANYSPKKSAKAVLEPTVKKWDHNSSGKVNRPYTYNLPASDQRVVSTEDTTNPVSGMKIVSTVEARNRLKSLGIDYADNALIPSGGIQTDEIQVALDQPKDVILVETRDSKQEIEANGRSVVVIGSASKITVKGYCEELLIAGKKNVVSTDSATSVQVYGDSNHLTLGDIGSGEIHGSYNRVDWKRPGSKPRLITSGVANDIAEAR